MAVRITSWKSTAEVVAGDLGAFKVVVKRLGADARSDVQALAERLRGDIEEAEALEIAQLIREQVESMVVGVLGLEFEWGEAEVEAPSTIDALVKAFERLDPLALGQRLAEIWTVCYREQFLPPFRGRLSAPTPASPSGADSSGPAPSGTTPRTAAPAGGRGSVKPAGASAPAVPPPSGAAAQASSRGSARSAKRGRRG